MKGLFARILLIGVLSGIVGLLVARFYARSVVAELATRFAAGILEQLEARGETERCASDPARWTFQVRDSFRTFAYDPVTRASSNPAAPPLDLELADRAAREASGIALRLGDPLRGGAVVQRVRASGACGLLQTTWNRPTTTSAAIGLYVAVAIAAGGMSVFLSFVLAIRPISRRVAMLRRSAAQVGDARGYESGGATDDDDLGQLSRELDRAHARIRRDADTLMTEHAALEDHLADVAHDLRTPIASLQLALEHALTTNHDPALRESLGRALEDTVYVSGLTENLRLETKMRGAWDPAEVGRVDLRTLVERVGLRLKFFAAQQQIDLAVAVPDDALFVSCHAIAVEQAVANVVENAVTLGVASGHVAVVLQPSPERRFVLTVVDDGPGVRVSELPRLGERTFRSDQARRRQPGGSGLGLAITAEVCRRSGWELTFEQEEPCGLRVTIRGPLTA